MFSIQSSSSDRELVFLAPQGDYFTVELRGTELQACRGVYAYTDSQGLAALFERLASHDRPWSGTEGWESLEAEFSLTARCTPLGVVTFAISIHGLPGVPEAWKLTAQLTSEMGQLPGIAANARRFFSVVGT